MIDKREEQKVIAKIRALMAKTTEAGATEEEAIAASEKVQEMLHKYQLDLSDIEIKESPITEDVYDTGQKGKAALDYAITSIANFTDTKCWRTYHPDYEHIQYAYFGLEHDVEIAIYMTKVIEWALVNGGEEFKNTDRWQLATPSRRTKLKFDFQVGMADRISRRLREMKAKQKQTDAQSTGRDLVVVKNAVVDQAWAEKGLRLRKGRGRSRSVDADSYRAGQVAGDKVQLNPGVGRNEYDQIG